MTTKEWLDQPSGIMTRKKMLLVLTTLFIGAYILGYMKAKGKFDIQL
jgi:hypothetical protein